jgi:TetR/AcrR family transcriptional repressor of nem operon
MPVLSKSQRTRQHIIEKSAPVFNRKGFSGTSMSDILEVTGLAKGGLYGNFDSKEEIAREVFRYSFEKSYNSVVNAVIKVQGPFEKLLAICDYYKDYTRNSPIEGGCPILNFSIEVDDTMPKLKREVRAGVEQMLNDLTRIIEKGKRMGEIRAEVHAGKFASFIYGQIEGSIFMAKAMDDHKRLSQAMEFLKGIIKTEMKA